jgi:hypothetical protein
MWADRFERDLTDVFALQDEVTVAVVSAIQPKLLQTEIAMATRRRPENLTAYDFYLRAVRAFYSTEPMSRKGSRVTWCPWARGCAGPRRTGKPLQIALDGVSGTTEAT